jgi:hypothetical protein
MLSAQRAHPYITPPIAVDATLKSGLVLARRDKGAITVNGFKYGSYYRCMKFVEHCLQALLEVKEFRWRSDGAPVLGLLMHLVP